MNTVSVDELEKRWDVLARCNSCSHLFKLPIVSWSLELVGNNGRIVIANVPQQCPQCGNLKVVQEPKDA